MAGALNYLAEDTVNYQIRIASNRRSEVRVGLHRQPVVPGVMRSVARPLHRAQHQVRQQTLFRQASDVARQPLKSSLRDRPMHRKLMPERLRDLRELFDFLEVR